MKTLWLLQYNNYYNRIVKREETLAGYQGYQVKYKGQMTDPNGNTAVLQNVNFIEGDFVNTTQVVNWAGDLPDYLLVIDEDQNIESRWFVVDAVKTRLGQLNLTLHRDLVVDFGEQIQQAPIFIEKATLSPDDPLIFNSENMTFNQIKTSETLIKDFTQMAWVVLYLTKDAEFLNVPVDFQDSYFLSFSEATWNASDIKTLTEKYSITAVDMSLSIRDGVLENTTVYPKIFTTRATGTSVSSFIPGAYTVTQFKKGINTDQVNSIFSPLLPQLESVFRNNANLGSGYTTQNLIATIEEYEGKTIRIVRNDGAHYYRIGTETITGSATIPKQTPQLQSIVETPSHNLYPAFSYPTLLTENYFATGNYTATKLVLEEVVIGTDSSIYLPSTRDHTIDAPYDIVCLPYWTESNDLTKNISISGPVMDWGAYNTDLIISAAMTMIKQGSGGENPTVLDAQILPFCPVQSFLTVDEDPTLPNFLFLVAQCSENSIGYVTQPSPWQEGVTFKIPIFVAPYASFEFTQQLSVSITNIKIDSECDMYRLCSPNYNGIFEFNAAKNRGVNFINVKCTYKPYTPYVKLYPNFKGLYGNDYNDARGLILGGDFSLPMMSDAWATYERQNKNYQNSFDRQIQNMELYNSIRRKQEVIQAVVGGIQGGVGGALTGMQAGGAAGAVVGGIVGAAASGVAGAMDINYNDQLRQEAMSYTKDQYGYQLGNIQALPASLSKTSAYNIDNKYFPFLEFYTCTETEKIALANKIRYNGMSTYAIGKISDYMLNRWEYQGIKDSGYVKGKLIRLENVATHIANAIATELFQGVFYRWE